MLFGMDSGLLHVEPLMVEHRSLIDGKRIKTSPVHLWDPADVEYCSHLLSVLFYRYVQYR